VTARPAAHLLDLTRLVSRQGRGALTGIDRVELAYLRRFLDGALPAFGLVRTPVGYLLLDRPGLAMVRALVQGDECPAVPDLLSRMMRPAQPARAAAEASLREIALARALPPLLGRMLRRHLPEDCHAYLVGHSDLTPRVLGALRTVAGAGITVLLHDTIPLDHPGYSRPDAPARFRRKLQAVSRGADRIICTTQEARDRAETHLARLGRVPPTVVAPLGIDHTLPTGAALPEGLPPDGPFLLCIGTIEPRKNHAFLLDLWERMHATLPQDAIPRLVLAGARGWADAGVFRRLDSLPFIGRTVLECPGLSDGAMSALRARARALLFPSLAEGFGLPPAEALAVGLPVIAAPLPALRETLGEAPTYLATDDPDGWIRAILAAAKDSGRRDPLPMPSWENHFNLVLSTA
jgi:glycosyltransferase involved in cell wall biosynthesis